MRTLASVVRRAADGEYVADLADAVAARGAGRELEDLGAAFGSLLADLRDKEQLTGLTPMTLSAQDLRDVQPIGARGVTRQIVGASSPRARLAARPGFAMEPGTILANRYLIDAVVGSGGLGIVYRARDRVLGEQVALKVLRPEVLANDDQAAAKLADELRVARRISHRNVVRVHDIGESDGVMFLTMEYVDGASLATIIETRGALQGNAVLSIARQLMRALAVMHAEGVVHGDLKPANLLLGPNGVLKLSDFGISRIVRLTTRDAATQQETRGDSIARLSGATVGTPEYMAPEQLIGALPTPASDIYAAGVVLHECLTGTTPFEAETRMTFLAHKLDVTPASTRAVPAIVTASSSLEAVIARMMAPTADARPASAASLSEEFAAI